MSKPPNSPGQRGGWCIHYTAPPNGLRVNAPHICAAGIDLVRFTGTKFDTRPCFLDKDTGESKPDAVACEHLRRPTQEEIAEHDRWLDGRLDRMRVVMAAIQPWRQKHKGKSFGETIECPVCKGQLHLSIAAYNGHVHGKCETPDCVNWME